MGEHPGEAIGPGVQVTVGQHGVGRADGNGVGCFGRLGPEGFDDGLVRHRVAGVVAVAHEVSPLARAQQVDVTEPDTGVGDDRCQHSAQRRDQTLHCGPVVQLRGVLHAAGESVVR